MKDKIILLIPNLDFGGAQRVFHDHATLLSERFTVIECAFNFNQKQAYPSCNKLVSLKVPAGKNLPDKILRFIQRTWRLYKLKKQEQPLVTISHLEGADYVNILSFGKGKKILVVHGSKVYDQEINNSFGFLRKKFLLPFLYKHADLIVSVSEGIRYELINSFNLSTEKVITIYNFFPIKKLKALAAESSNLRFNDGLRQSISLVTTGRLVKQKNQLPLLWIIKYLKKNYQIQVQLFFLGDGPLKQELVNAAKDLSLEVGEYVEGEIVPQTEIVFLGYQQNPFRFFKEMDLFLFPSAWEGFPMALGEAMAVGIPIISSDCPTGPLELLQPDWADENQLKVYPRICTNGVLLPIPSQKKPETIKVWADTIFNVLQDNELKGKMVWSGQKRMRALDKELMKEKWLNISMHIK